jgi:hypothetical protein
LQVWQKWLDTALIIPTVELVPLILKLWAGPSVLLALIEFNLLPRCLLSLAKISLIPERFEKITRGGDLTEVIKGIDAAIQAGMSPVKINMVAMRGVNDDEIESMVDFAITKGIDVRFIVLLRFFINGIYNHSLNFIIG